MLPHVVKQNWLQICKFLKENKTAKKEKCDSKEQVIVSIFLFIPPEFGGMKGLQVLIFPKFRGKLEKMHFSKEGGKAFPGREGGKTNVFFK